MARLEVQKVTKSFGGRLVLDGVSFTVEAGQCLLLSGPSGSGKTTLLRILAGLETPDTGRVRIDGREATSGGIIIPPHARRMGFVFQDLALWPHLRAAQHLDLVLRGPGLSRAERKARVSTVLDKCVLAPFGRAYPASLSGGEAQRLAIARALAPSPQILLMDEPFAHLDDALRRTIASEIERLKDEEQTAVVLAAHHAGSAMNFVDATLPLQK